MAGMTREFVLKILRIAAPLLYVIAGALISLLSMWWLDNRRSRRDRQEKLAGLTREALAAALKWIQPMRFAQMRASSLVMAAIHGAIDNEQFLKKYPNLLADLARREIPGSLQAVLPEGIYARSLSMVSRLDELQHLALKQSQETHITGQIMPGFQVCRDKINALEKQIAQLEADLRRESLDTFK